MYLLRYCVSMTIIKDPLGLKELEAAVAELRFGSARLADAPSETWRSLVARLDTAHRAFAVKMELLRDRYGLLKRSSAQLADEVAWLRDQIDDLSSAEDAPKPGTAQKSPSAAGAGQTASAERRYTDRWKGRRP
jgi:hypothetical protein